MSAVESLHVAKEILRLSRSQWWSRHKIDAYQKVALIRMLQHAARTVPYYRELGINPESITSVDDLHRFPILTKRVVQKEGDRLLSEAFPKAALYSSVTSGTSGEPTTTYFDPDCWRTSKYALKLRRMLAYNAGLFKTVVVVSEQTPDEIRSAKQLGGSGWLFKKQELSIHDSLEKHWPVLSSINADAIYAFPSYLQELINFCEARAYNLPKIPVVFTSSEVLPEPLRVRIESAFNARVCDIYGSTEFKELAWECEYGSRHLNFESAFIEAQKAAAHCANGKLRITSLLNRAMPLIRFEVGDEGAIRPVKCQCGRQSPAIERIDGRSVDMVRLPDGRRLSPYLLTTAIESHPGIAQYQLLQSSLQAFELRYVAKDAPLSCEEMKSIAAELAAQLGAEVNVDVFSVSAIERTSRGKFRVFVQGIAPD